MVWGSHPCGSLSFSSVFCPLGLQASASRRCFFPFFTFLPIVQCGLNNLLAILSHHNTFLCFLNRKGFPPSPLYRSYLHSGPAAREPFVRKLIFIVTVTITVFTFKFFRCDTPFTYSLRPVKSFFSTPPSRNFRVA